MAARESGHPPRRTGQASFSHPALHRRVHPPSGSASWTGVLASESSPSLTKKAFGHVMARRFLSPRLPGLAPFALSRRRGLPRTSARAVLASLRRGWPSRALSSAGPTLLPRGRRSACDPRPFRSLRIALPGPLCSAVVTRLFARTGPLSPQRSLRPLRPSLVHVARPSQHPASNHPQLPRTPLRVLCVS